MTVDVFLTVGVVAFLMSLTGFLLSRILGRNDVADVLWGPGFLAVYLSVYYWNTETVASFKTWLVMSLVSVWALRLALYIGVRSLGKPEDIRYQNFRKSWGNREPLWAYLQVFFLQSLLMGLISLPLVLVAQASGSEVGPLDFLGLTLFVIGFVFEVAADEQLRLFKKDPANRGKVLDQGVWALSRHPNYFGEVLLWWGLFFFAVPLPGGYWTVVSPLLLTFLILRVSGVSMLDKVMKEKGEEFERYCRQVPAFFPFKSADIFQFAKVVFIVGVLDFIWLGTLFKEFYVRQAYAVARIQEGSFDPVIWAAAGVYFFIPLGIVSFALREHSRSQAAFKGALLGLCLYGVYDLTNIALVSDWPLELALLDILWGPLLCGLTSWMAFKKK